jgi:hypothetical protein
MTLNPLYLLATSFVRWRGTPFRAEGYFEGKMMGASTAPLPSFIAVGPTRTATTWLYQVLKGHIGLPSGIKETQFFIWNYDLGLTWYRRHFRNCSPHLPVMEIAPTYFDSPEARERVKLHIPECKIICTSTGSSAA